MTREFIDFVNAHRDEDTARLLLSAARYPSIDMPAAVQQIEGLRAARDKWPSLSACDDYRYPPRLNREQASSEAAAGYKASLAVPPTVADLTGGMGVDTQAFARVAKHVDYVERDPKLCALMEHNLRALGVGNVSVHCADSLQWLSTSHAPFSTLFVDPARRAASGRKVAAFEDCEPNILQHLDLLRKRCTLLMVKASPMIDIDLACRQLGDVAEVHVLSLRGECKEVLFLCRQHEGETAIHCILRDKAGGSRDWHFTRSEDAAAEPRYCTSVGRYLYEPDAALMKGGAFNLIGQRLDLDKLAPNTHLYTADRIVDAFPGRTFRVLQEVKPSRKAVAEAVPDGKAHVVVRNYPVAAVDLQRRLDLTEGGDLFILAATHAGRPVCWLCCREA